MNLRTQPVRRSNINSSNSRVLALGQRNATGLWLALGSFLVAGVLPGIVVLAPDNTILLLGLLASFAIPIGGITWCILHSERLNLYDPLYWFLGVFLFSYPIRAVYAYVVKSPEAILPLRFYYESLDEITGIALMVAAGGAASFIAGYHAPIWKHVNAKWFRDRRQGIVAHATVKLWLLFSIGLIFTAIKFRNGNFSVFIRDSSVDTSTAYTIELISRLTLYTPILAAAILVTKSGSQVSMKVTLVATTLVCVIISLMGGAKLPLLLLAAGLSYPFYITARRKMRNVVVGAAIVIMVLLFPFMNGFRAYYIETIGYTTSIKPRDVLSIVENLPRLLTIVGEQSTARVIINRTVALDSLMLAIKYTPQVHDFQYGRDLVVIPLTSLIPRAFWPDKPVASLTAEDFTVKYVGSTASAHDQYWAGGTAITPMADLYINLHVFGVLVGTFMIGAIANLLRSVSENLLSPMAILVFVLGYVSLINFDPPLSGIMSDWLKVMLLLFVVNRILKWT